MFWHYFHKVYFQKKKKRIKRGKFKATKPTRCRMTHRGNNFTLLCRYVEVLYIILRGQLLWNHFNCLFVFLQFIEKPKHLCCAGWDPWISFLAVCYVPAVQQTTTPSWIPLNTAPPGRRYSLMPVLYICEIKYKINGKNSVVPNSIQIM